MKKHLSFLAFSLLFSFFTKAQIQRMTDLSFDKNFRFIEFNVGEGEIKGTH